MSNTTLLLSRSEVSRLLSPSDCIAVVEHAFRAYGEGSAVPPAVSAVRARDGGFHVKSGILNLSRDYFAAKINANFPSNRLRHHLPTIQGVILLCDAVNGEMLALVDSIEITIMRTGAATALAARLLSRDDSSVVTIIGCGNQGRVSLRMLRQVRKIETVFVFDLDRSASATFCKELSKETGLRIESVDEPSRAVRKSDICITCTPSRQAFLMKEWVRPGTFIAAVGADSEEKQELDPVLVAASKLVTDLTEQCAAFGEMHHALAADLVAPSHPHAELGEIIAGKKTGRVNSEEIIVFDSTGMALQDVSTTALVYEKALEQRIGMRFDFPG